MLCAKAIITGIVRIDNTLIKAVTFDANAVSRLYFAANITVLLAVGADALKAQAVSNVPPKPKSFNEKIVTSGTIITFTSAETKIRLSENNVFQSADAKYVPNITIASGVLRSAIYEIGE